MQSSFNDAVREQNLRVAGYPRIEPKTAAAPADGALEFAAMFEVYPEVKIGDLGDADDRAAGKSKSRRRTSTTRSRSCASSARRSSR